MYTFFDIYGPDYQSLLYKRINPSDVTKVGKVFAFYLSHVYNPHVCKRLTSDTKKVIICPGCQWQLVFKRTSGGRSQTTKTRNKDLFGDWHLAKVPEQHDICHVSSKSSTLDINTELFIIHSPALVNALSENPKLTFKEAKKLWPLPFSLNPCSPSVFVRARQAVQLLLDRNTKFTYNNLPSYLHALKELNPGMMIALQLDSHQQFYRMFIVFLSLWMTMAFLPTILCRQMVSTSRTQSMMDAA